MIRNSAIFTRQIPIDVHINISIHRYISITTVFCSMLKHFCENNVTKPCTVQGNILEIVIAKSNYTIISGTDIIDHQMFLTA